MGYEHVSYGCITIGNVVFHISKNRIDGKIQYRTTRTVVNNSEQIIKEKNNGSTKNNES